MRKRAWGTSALIEGQISPQKYSTPSTFGSQSMAPTKVMRGADAARGLGAKFESELGSNSAGAGRYCARSTPVETTVTQSPSTHCVINERTFAETAITCWNLRTAARS